MDESSITTTRSPLEYRVSAQLHCLGTQHSRKDDRYCLARITVGALADPQTLRQPSGPGFVCVLVATLLVSVVPLGAGQPSPDDALALETFEFLSVPTEHHRHLERLIGNWTTNGRYLLPSGEAIETSGAIKTVAIMNGLFVESRLVGELFGKPDHGRSIEGFDTVTEKYVNSFVETLGPSIVAQSGACENDGRVRTMVGDVRDPV